MFIVLISKTSVGAVLELRSDIIVFNVQDVFDIFVPEDMVVAVNTTLTGAVLDLIASSNYIVSVVLSCAVCHQLTFRQVFPCFNCFQVYS